MTTWAELQAETSDEMMPVLHAIGMSWRKFADSEGRTGDYVALEEKVRERYACGPDDDSDTVLGAYFLRSMHNRDKLAVAYVFQCAMNYVEEHERKSIPAIRRTIIASARALKALKAAAPKAALSTEEALKAAEDKPAAPGVSR